MIDEEKIIRKNEWMRFWSILFIAFSIGLFVGASLGNWKWYFWVSYAIMVASAIQIGFRVWWEIESFSAAHKFRLRKEQQYGQTNHKTT